MATSNKKFNNVFQFCGISEERFNLLFSLGNMYGIFRADSAVRGNSSRYYKLDGIYECRHNSIEAVLTDIAFAKKSGILGINLDDVIVIKLEGKFFSYRYCGNMYLNSSFVETRHFVDEERQEIMDKIHVNKMVMSVTDGRLLPLADVGVKIAVYCIGKEVYTLKSSRVLSNYSLYVLNDDKVECINPHGKPFISISNVMFYYKTHKENAGGRKTKSLLLADIKELERVRDYRDLENAKLFIG